MRNAVRKKLHSQTGASLLIALLYFLVAMTVGAVVLTAAASNAGRLARSRQEQQNYLAVASAALLVQEDFQGITFKAGYQKTTQTSEDESGNPHYDVYYGTTLPALSGEGKLLKDGPTDDLAQLYYSTVPVLNKPAPTVMNYSLEIKAKDLPTVSGAMKVEMEDTEKARYTITVELYVKEEDGTPVNTTTLLFVPSVHNMEATSWEPDKETTRYTTTVAWGAPVITKGAAA